MIFRAIFEPLSSSMESKMSNFDSVSPSFSVLFVVSPAVPGRTGDSEMSLTSAAKRPKIGA